MPNASLPRGLGSYVKFVIEGYVDPHEPFRGEGLFCLVDSTFPSGLEFVLIRQTKTALVSFDLTWAIFFPAFSHSQSANRTLAGEIALAGKFYVPKEHKVTDSGEEQLLLHATVEELVRHDLALRENADDRRYLVFPSQFNRDYESLPEPKGKAVAITFDGPIQSL